MYIPQISLNPASHLEDLSCEGYIHDGIARMLSGRDTSTRPGHKRFGCASQ